MSDENVRESVEEMGGVASTADIADLLEVNEQSARRWARCNRLPRIGSGYAFTTDMAEEFADELAGELADDTDADTPMDDYDDE